MDQKASERQKKSDRPKSCSTFDKLGTMERTKDLNQTRKNTDNTDIKDIYTPYGEIKSTERVSKEQYFTN